MIVWQLDSQLSMQSMPITTEGPGWLNELGSWIT